ncbi:26S proteasome non-ATPase regulatory subunit 10 [Venturia nashicola]|nr:26S proteasome non-ATPase regulatory subunit 10 [Venturia nashicola]
MIEPKTSKFEIHEAARDGRLSIVESLLSANPKLASLRDEDDRLPLHWAVSYNHIPIVQLLLQAKDFDVDARDGIGWTPLMMATSRQDGDAMVDLLISRGADVNATNNGGQTALHFAASKNNLDIARKLIAHKASPRTKDRKSHLPLHRAAAIGSIPMMKLFLENKSPLSAGDVYSMTALHHAIIEGHGDAAVFLLKEGAEHDRRDSDGNLAIQLAPDVKVKTFVLQAAEREGIQVTQR